MRILRSLTCVVFFIIQLFSASGQEPHSIWMSGDIINSDDSTAIPMAQIASYRKVLMYATDSVGHFNLLLSSGDSLKIIALGFEPLVYHLNDTSVRLMENVTIPLKRISYMIKQVDINHYQSYREYADRLNAIHSKATEMDLKLPSDIKLGQGSSIPAPLRPVFSRKPPVYVALIHPLSFVSYYTGKKEKERRRMLHLIHDESIRNKLSADLIQELTGLKGQDLNSFVVYCNTKIKMGNSDTSMTIQQKVMDLYALYLADIEENEKSNIGNEQADKKEF